MVQGRSAIQLSMGKSAENFSDRISASSFPAAACALKAGSWTCARSEFPHLSQKAGFPATTYPQCVQVICSYCFLKFARLPQQGASPGADDLVVCAFFSRW